MKKIFLIALTVITIFVLNVHAFAFPILDSSQDMTLEKRLYTPERYIARLTDDTGMLYGDYGAYFPCSPFYKADHALPVTSVTHDAFVNNGVLSEIPEWLREFTQQVSKNTLTVTLPVGPVGTPDIRKCYINNLVLARRGNYQTEDAVIVQLDFPRVYVNPDSLYVDFPEINSTTNYDYSTFNFVVYADVLYQDMLTARFRVRYAIQEGDSVAYETYDEQFEFDVDPYTIPLYQIIEGVERDAASKEKEIAYFDEYICIDSLTFVCSSSDGNIKIEQYEKADISYVDLQEMENGFSRFNFVQFLTDSVGGFFGTTLFELGGVTVTFGTAFAVPFVFMILIAFLKKFSGG